MTEQWQELKETITELRDNDGTGTQQEVSKFLVNLMDVLEKKMSSSEKPSQWIPCSERLPEEGKEVLISSDSGIYIAELEILDGNVYWNETIEYRSVKRVSAWCPLPEPYKGEDNETD